VVYITADCVQIKEYNSVRLIMGQSTDVNGSIQYGFPSIQRINII